jgi:copper(I)-binding protein
MIPATIKERAHMSTRHPLGRVLAGAAVVVLAATGLVACGDDSDDAKDDPTTTTEAATTKLEVSDVWARPVEDLTAKDTSAIYMVITGGSEDDALVKASVPADVAGTVELHETVAADDSTSTTMAGDMESTTTTAMGGDMSTTTAMDGSGGDMGGGMMTMQPVESIPVPAGEKVELAPGGYHIMLLEVKKVLAVGDTIEVTLTFEKAGEITTTAEVREP